MTDAKAPEPSIEEILASIRKIISDDEPEEPMQVHAESPQHEEQPATQPQEEEEILELTDVFQEPPVHQEHAQEPEHHEPVAPVVEPPHEHQHHEHHHAEHRHEDSLESIISDATVVAASDAFAKLSHPDAGTPEMPTARGQTVEDIVRDLLRPILRQWIDQNLPGIVERLVERELRKISRKAEDL